MLTIEVKLNHKDLEKLEYILKEDELPITENEIKLLIKRLINRRYLRCWLISYKCILKTEDTINLKQFLFARPISKAVSFHIKKILPFFRGKIGVLTTVGYVIHHCDY